MAPRPSPLCRSSLGDARHIHCLHNMIWHGGPYYIDDLNDQKVFKKPVVTTLEPLTRFYPAEAYHQDYVCKNPSQGYVRAVALPKVEKVRKVFKSMLKKGADSVD